MEKWKDLNMDIRMFVISRVLRLEQTTSELLRYMLRMFNPQSKTLGNQSSALSFKSKVDLLLDLDEIDKTQYNHLLKLMEIRNQFAHNHNAVSFLSLDEINPDINKYLLKNSYPEAEQETNRELKLKKIFNKLFEATSGHLLITCIEYKAGFNLQTKRYFNHIVVENLDIIWANVYEYYKTYPRLPFPSFIDKEKEFNIIKSKFELSLSEFRLSEMDKFGDNFKEIYKLKETEDNIVQEINNKDKVEKENQDIE